MAGAAGDLEFDEGSPSLRQLLAWQEFRARELYGEGCRLEADVPAERQARAFRLRHISSRDLCIDDRLDRETLAAQRTRDSLLNHPFYGARAEQARARGDEWSYWRSVAGFTYVLSSEESAVLTAQCERRDELARIHLPKAQANMASKALHLPPLSMALAEAARRFGFQTAALVSVARREGREAELCELLVRAIESGEFPGIYAFMDRTLATSAAKARGGSPLSASIA